MDQELIKQKRKEYDKEYRRINADILKAKRQIWYQKNKEIVQVYKREYYLKNRDKFLQRSKEQQKSSLGWYHRNRDKINAKKREYYQLNRTEILSRMKEKRNIKILNETNHP
jgi:hypothetical protein